MLGGQEDIDITADHSHANSWKWQPLITSCYTLTYGCSRIEKILFFDNLQQTLSKFYLMTAM